MPSNSGIYKSLSTFLLVPAPGLSIGIRGGACQVDTGSGGSLGGTGSFGFSSFISPSPTGSHNSDILT